jgi:uncharacterized RDD family membrane protein YckC
MGFLDTLHTALPQMALWLFLFMINVYLYIAIINCQQQSWGKYTVHHIDDQGTHLSVGCQLLM